MDIYNIIMIASTHCYVIILYRQLNIEISTIVTVAPVRFIVVFHLAKVAILQLT